MRSTIMRPRWAIAISRLVGSPITAASSRPSRPTASSIEVFLVSSPYPSTTSNRPASTRPPSARSRAAQSMAATEALASVEPRPKRRVPSIAGVNGSRVQPAPGGTVSRWETSASVCPCPKPLTSTRTEVSSRTTSSPQPRTVCSTNSAMVCSPPLTEGMATSSSRSSTSPGKVHSQVGCLLLPPDDHGSSAGPAEDLEQQGIGGAALDDVGALDAAGGGADAGFHLGPHAAGERAARHEARKVVGIGESDEGGGVGAVAEHTGRAGEED